MSAAPSRPGRQRELAESVLKFVAVRDAFAMLRIEHLIVKGAQGHGH